MKQCPEYLRGLRYKLRMMGIPVLGPTYVSRDNQYVLANSSVSKSQLRNKSHSIAYHFVREGVAHDEWRTAYVNTHSTIATCRFIILVDTSEGDYVISDRRSLNIQSYY